MDLCVVGTGYVGLVTGTVFSDLGCSVLGVDKDEAKIAMLNDGLMPIYEPGLEEMVRRNLTDGRIRFSSDLGGCIECSDIVFIAVGTPPREDGHANLDAVFDLREGKSLEIVEQLLAAGAKVRAYDPVAMGNARKVLPHIDYCDSAYDAARGADAIILVTEWNEFKFLDFDRLKEAMNAPVIFDGRNMFRPERMRDKGFIYHCIGRPATYEKER